MGLLSYINARNMRKTITACDGNQYLETLTEFDEFRHTFIHLTLHKRLTLAS